MTPAEQLDSDLQLVTIEQTAILLNCLKAAVHRLVKRGALEGVGEGTELRVTLESILAHIESQRVKQRAGYQRNSRGKPANTRGTVFFDNSKNLWYAQSAPDRLGNREKSLGYKTEEEAIAWLVQYDQDRKDKMKREWSRKKLKDFLEYWLSRREKSGKLKASTIRG